MTRSQRRWHAATWLLLGPLALAVLLLALSGRRPTPTAEQPASEMAR